jgi:hypothetical protein
MEALMQILDWNTMGSFGGARSKAEMVQADIGAPKSMQPKGRRHRNMWCSLLVFIARLNRHETWCEVTAFYTFLTTKVILLRNSFV